MVDEERERDMLVGKVENANANHFGVNTTRLMKPGFSGVSFEKGRFVFSV